MTYDKERELNSPPCAPMFFLVRNCVFLVTPFVINRVKGTVMQFSDFGPRTVIAAFDGGEITSDAGALLLRQCERRLDLSRRMAGCFEDHRDGARVRHALADLLNQRVSAIALSKRL